MSPRRRSARALPGAHPDDPGWLAWVVTIRRTRGVPQFVKVCTAGWTGEPPSPVAVVWATREDAEEYLASLPDDIRGYHEVLPVITYFAVGDTGEGTFEVRAGKLQEVE